MIIALFSGHTQFSLTCSTEKRERAWYLFTREWRQDIKDSKKGLSGAQNSKKSKGTYVAYYYSCLASEERPSNPQSLSVVGRTICIVLPAHSMIIFNDSHNELMCLMKQ